MIIAHVNRIHALGSVAACGRGMIPVNAADFSKYPDLVDPFSSMTPGEDHEHGKPDLPQARDVTALGAMTGKQ